MKPLITMRNDAPNHFGRGSLPFAHGAITSADTSALAAA
jgi:hypothetical protein